MVFIGSLTAKSSCEIMMAAAKVAVIKLPARVVCNAVFVNRNIVLLFGCVSQCHDVNFFFFLTSCRVFPAPDWGVN